MWMIIGAAVLAIAIGVIAQRGFGRVGLAWFLAAFALEIMAGWALLKEPPGFGKPAVEIGAFIIIGGVTLVLMLCALFSLPKHSVPQRR
jgi:hypothetical protein